MIRLMLAFMLLSFGSSNGDPFLGSHSQSQQINSALIPLTIIGMPVTLNAAVAESSLGESWLVYSTANISHETIAGTYVRVFIVDASGKLSATEEGFSLEEVRPGTTVESRVRIARPIDQNGLSIVAVTKVIGHSGVWEVDPSDLKRVVAARINGRRDESLKVNYEPHTKVSGLDRAEIFELLLNDLLSDANKAERLKDPKNVLVLSENVDFNLPRIQNVNLAKLDKEEIQRIADERGRVFYLIYRPFVIEGARVLARVSIRDQRARRPGAYIPSKFTYLFICIKKDGRWTIERSLGYAQS